MLIFSFNKSRGIKIAVISAFAVILTLLCVIIALNKRPPVPEYATADEIGNYSTEATDTKAQEKFLRQFGIKADTTTKRSDEVTIPSDFDEIYNNYNELQRAVGLDLTPFRGEKVSRVVFRLKDKDKYATLLIFKSRVIGGHVSTGVYCDGYEALNGTTG